MKKLPDWAVRAVKTFAQTFLGVFIPAVAMLLNDGFPDSVNAVWVVIAPAIASALSAAICAAWNIIAEAWKIHGGENK